MALDLSKPEIPGTSSQSGMRVMIHACPLEMCFLGDDLAERGTQATAAIAIMCAGKAELQSPKL